MTAPRKTALNSDDCLKPRADRAQKLAQGSMNQEAANEMIPVHGALSNLASSSHLHLALAQVLPCDDDPKQGHSLEAGFEKLSAYARRAAEEGADVVAFPEYFLAGSSHQSWYGVRERGGPLPLDRHNETRKEQDEQHWLEQVCALARELDLNIVAGTVVELGPHMKGEKHQVPHRGEVSKSEEDASEAKEPLFNTAYFVGRHGDVRGKYTKRVRRLNALIKPARTHLAYKETDLLRLTESVAPRTRTSDRRPRQYPCVTVALHLYHSS